MFKKIVEKFNGLSSRKKQTMFFTAVFIVGAILIAYGLYLYFGTHKFKLYTNDYHGISIKYPEQWTVREDIPGVVVAFVSPKEGELDVFQENLTVIIQKITVERVTFKQYTAMAIKQLVGVFKGYVTVDESKSAYISGEKAHKFVYHESLLRNPRPTKMMHVWCLKNGNAYQVTYGSLVSSYDKYIGTISKMIASLKIR